MFTKKYFNKFVKSGAKEFIKDIKDKIEEICSKGKLSVEEVTYLFTNDYDNF